MSSIAHGPAHTPTECGGCGGSPIVAPPVPPPPVLDFSIASNSQYVTLIFEDII